MFFKSVKHVRGELRDFQGGTPTREGLERKDPALFANIRLGWNCRLREKTYFDTSPMVSDKRKLTKMTTVANFVNGTFRVFVRGKPYKPSLIFSIKVW
jgi:hypothetical protein